MAWLAATPDFIFPLPPATNTDGYNQNLTEPLWPPLAYDGDGGASAVNPQESLSQLADLQQRRQDRHDRAEELEVVGRRPDHQPGFHLCL